eukprot:CAMPEP_0171325306 /NCGR_PEP_ID=MMETSP0816-20121228/116730_1 /TAXON_ID=420281 /ORGANISM="Proboscia inermis, Strain CCAP1064/1" /LENGTH=763 /DNA_ID=CAMNT_0011824461 /DNA_START=15 /DNA_END=2304 /DNA_ORIENTATION=-
MSGIGGVCIPEEGNEVKISNDVPPNETSNIADGLYISSSNVDDRAAIAQDVKAISNALKSGNARLAKDIYEGGLNSNIYDAVGINTGEKRSLAGFSKEAQAKMNQESTFNIFRYALQDSYGNYMDEPAGKYADTFVNFAFSNTKPKALAADAMVALNLWMYISHVLYDTVTKCEASTNSSPMGVFSSSGALAQAIDEAAAFGSVTGVFSSSGALAQAIDEAAAFWIGDSQQTGNSRTGHLLYALTEKIGESFGQDTNGQVLVNTNILKLLNNAKSTVTFVNACGPRSNTHLVLRVIVDKIIIQMTIPLIQNLLYNLKVYDAGRVKLYALSVVPLIAGCNPSSYSYLKAILIDGEYHARDFSDVVKALQSSYSCLGLSCSEIGTYNGIACDDRNTAFVSMGGYLPTHNVMEHAKIDIDILQIQIFMKMRAYGAAKECYMYGRNSYKGDERRSLRDFSTSIYRQVIPQYKTYTQYYDDLDYAHTLILQAFEEEPPFSYISSDQKHEIVIKTLQHMVMGMYALRGLYDANNLCSMEDDSSNTKAEISWDEGAAFLIGSLAREGNKLGDGVLLYSFANEMCPFFDTCTKWRSGVSRVSKELVTLLYAGQAELESRNCQALVKTTNEINSLLYVPLFQGALYYSSMNQDLAAGSPEGTRAAAFIFSRAILPVINVADRTSASAIDVNLDFDSNYKPIPDGLEAVFGAFETAVQNMDGVDCTDIGSFGTMNACQGGTGSESKGKRSGARFIGLSHCMLFVTLILFHLVW